MRTADFTFDLPPQLIAQHPTRQRDGSRLLVMHRDSSKLEHRLFPDLLDYVTRDDLVVMNNSRVIPARLRGVNVKTGGRFELLLLEEVGLNDWWAMLRPGKRARDDTADAVGTIQNFSRDLAHAIKLLDGDYIFMRGYLKNAVARRVDDREPRRDVLDAQFLDDFCSRGRFISQRASADLALELGNDVLGKSIRIHRKCLVEPNARHLPMTGRRVLPR